MPGAVAGDAVADSVEPAQTLDIKVDEATRLLVFVTDDRLGGFDVPDPRQAGALQDAADSGWRNPGFQSDMPTRQPLPPQLGHAQGQGFPGLARDAPWPRRTVAHRSAPASPIPSDPAGHDLGANARHLPGLRLAQPARDHGNRHLLSTTRRQSGILVDVHSARS